MKLQLKRAERNVLRGNMQRAAEGKFAGAPAQRFFGGDAGHRRVIVLLGKVREDKMARAPVEHFAIGEKFADDGIGKMAGAAHHALLDVPGIGAHLQHFEIVIGFEDQEISFAQMMFHKLGQVTEVGDDGDFYSIGAEA